MINKVLVSGVQRSTVKHIHVSLLFQILLFSFRSLQNTEQGSLCHRASLGTRMVKHLPAMWETWFQSLGWGDPLKKGMAIYSSSLTWGIPWSEEAGGYSPWGRKESDVTEHEILKSPL